MSGLLDRFNCLLCNEMSSYVVDLRLHVTVVVVPTTCYVFVEVGYL
jgi:hypothetical protein